MQRSEKRWDSINNSMGQRFQYYEDYLRQEKSYKLLKERLTNLKLDSMVPELKISQNVLLKMDGSINLEQRERFLTHDVASRCGRCGCAARERDTQEQDYRCVTHRRSLVTAYVLESRPATQEFYFSLLNSWPPVQLAEFSSGVRDRVQP